MQFGSTFRGDYQKIDVNCWAETVDDDEWKQGTFVVGYGESWYYGRLAHHHRGQGDILSDEYLIRDQVGSDGWGIITVFRNVELIDNMTRNEIPRQQEPVSW
jgi:hypothetical protein